MLFNFLHSLMFQYAFKYVKSEIPYRNLHSLMTCILLKIHLFYYVYLHFNQSKKVGKPIGYRTSLNDLNIHTKQLHRMITMNTLLQIYIKNEYKTFNAW